MNQTIRDCDQCAGTTATGARCSRRTCKLGRYCFQHLSKEQGLAVKNSTIPGAGQGLFTTKDITIPANKKRSGVPLIQYTGEQLTNAQHDARYGEDERGQYVLRLGPNRYIDARSTQASVARYANACDRPGHQKPCNARFDVGGKLVVIKKLKKGQEVLTRYGNDYFV
jgi:uncharacterized protein